jgi:hypothetical protein
MVGPKPNGYIWPTIVRFTTARVGVTMQQVSTEWTEQYRLRAIDPSSDRLDGLFDGEGFRP